MRVPVVIGVVANVAIDVETMMMMEFSQFLKVKLKNNFDFSQVLFFFFFEENFEFL